MKGEKGDTAFFVLGCFFFLFFPLQCNSGTRPEGPACGGRAALGFVNHVHSAPWGRDRCLSMRPSPKWNFPNGDFGDGYYEFVGISFPEHCFISQSVKLSKSHPGRIRNHHNASTSRCLPRSKQLLTVPAVSSPRVLVCCSAPEALGVYFLLYFLGLFGGFFFVVFFFLLVLNFPKADERLNTSALSSLVLQCLRQQVGNFPLEAGGGKAGFFQECYSLPQAVRKERFFRSLPLRVIFKDKCIPSMPPRAQLEVESRQLGCLPSTVVSE